MSLFHSLSFSLALMRRRSHSLDSDTRAARCFNHRGEASFSAAAAAVVVATCCWAVMAKAALGAFAMTAAFDCGNLACLLLQLIALVCVAVVVAVVVVAAAAGAAATPAASI